MFFTNFIIFDLEFNSTRIPNTDKHINEIIEIGAVKLNENLDEIDSFTCLVRPAFSKKLNSFVKKLTHIKYTELLNSPSFSKVINQFIKWCNPDEDTVFITWSDTDLHVLVENYKEFLGTENITFIEKYSDLQKYVSNFIKTENNNQISLKSAAEHYLINTENFSLHRAEDDSRVCGNILRLSYEEKIFEKHIRQVHKENYFERLLFKPYVITDLKKEGIDKDNLFFDCPVCSNTIKFNGKYNARIKAFTSIIKCDKCKKKIAASFRFKKTFDKVIVAKHSREYIKKKNTADK